MGILKFVGKQFKEIGEAVVDGLIYEDEDEELSENQNENPSLPTSEDMTNVALFGLNGCQSASEYTRRLMLADDEDT